MQLKMLLYYITIKQMALNCAYVSPSITLGFYNIPWQSYVLLYFHIPINVYVKFEFHFFIVTCSAYFPCTV